MILFLVRQPKVRYAIAYRILDIAMHAMQKLAIFVDLKLFPTARTGQHREEIILHQKKCSRNHL